MVVLAFVINVRVEKFKMRSMCFSSAKQARNRPDAHLFLLVQMHHKILEQFTLFKQPSSWENCAGWFTSCKQKWYMDLPGSACAPRSPTSQQFLDAIRYRQTINLGQFELTLREHIIGGWRDLDILTPHEAHHSSRVMRTYHTHFGVPLGNTSGWWDDRKRNQKPVLPLYLSLDIPSNLSRALCPALFPWFSSVFWFGYRLISKLPFKCPPEAYIVM